MIRRFVQWAARGDRPAENSGGSKLFFEPMEPKILLSADALSGLLPTSPSSDEHSAPLTMQDSVELFEDLAGDEQALAASPDDAPSLDELGASLLSPGELSDRLELVFIDANAPDYQQLLQGIGDRPGVETKVFVLEADTGGTAQISSILAEYQDVDAIHLLSHGDDTGFQLGRDWVGISSLDKFSNDFSNWDQSLSQNADILIYGCNLASDPAGERLLNDLARLTGADIAASDDLTGHASLGGDWDLEFASGDIDTSIIADADLQDLWAGALATETLNPSQDTYVNKGSDTTNYGASQYLVVDKSGDEPGDQTIFVQFDLSTIPAGSTITSATLYYTVVDVTGSLTVKAFQVTEAWEGNTVTYDTRPDYESDSTPPSVNAWAGQTGDHEWDITSFVQDWVDGTAGNYGVMLGTSESGSEQVQYYSSESGNSPRLEVIYDNSLTATDNAGEVTEDGPASASGNVIADDDGAGVDSDSDGPVSQLVVSEVNGSAGNVASVVAGSYGSVTIGSDGSYTYTLDNTSEDVQALAVGETLTEIFSYTLSDQGSDTSTAALTITINGTNDAPVATANSNLLAGGATSVSGNMLTDDNGAGVDSDIDGDTLSVSAIDAAGGDQYGTLTLNDADGSYTYALDTGNATVLFLLQALGFGQTLTETYEYTVSDGQGGSDTATLTITIRGTNSVPVATANSNAIAEGEASVSGNMLADDDGAGVDTDIDDDTLSVSAIDATGADQYGTLTLNDADGSYTYAIDNSNPAVQALGVGQSLTEVYTYTASDGLGGSDTATLTITITGTNDVPVATANGNQITEDAVSVSGNMLTDDDGAGVDSDIDGDTLSVSAIDTSGADQYGTLTLNDADGSYTYAIDNSNPAVQALGVGQSLTEVYTYTVSDGQGGTDTATLTITINGSNDQPVLGTAQPDQTSTDGETITPLDVSVNFSDVDTSDVLTFSASNLPTGLSIDTNTGVISGTIDGSASQSGPFNVTITADDGSATRTDTFLWTVTNPGPTATDNTGSVTEDGPSSASGNVITDDDGDGIDSDPDDPVSQLVVSEVDGSAGDVGTAVAGSYGTVTIGSDGNYTYNLDNTAAAVQALAAGEALTDTFSYTVSDGQGGTDTATLTITISGTNDQPVLGTAQPDQTSEDGETITPLDMSGNFSDVDTSDALTFSASNLPTGLSIDSNTGVISGTIDGSASQSGPFNVTITADDGSGAGNATRTDTFLWKVTTPVLTATDNAGSVTEDGPANASGNVITDDDGDGVDSDPDGPVSQLVVSEVDGNVGDVGTTVAGSYGSVTIDPDGGYTYNLDNTSVAVQALAAGETLTDTFSYTMSDQDGNTDTASLTITITGSNDAPVIIGGPDSVALNETDSGLASNGDFTVSDLDTSDSVTASVNGLVVGGTSDRTDPAAPSDADLEAMLTVSPTATVGGASNSATLSWSFDSASEAFDYLAAGETLELTYTLRAEDSQGATANETVTITITGTNDAPTVSGLQESTSYSGGSGMVPLNDIVISDVDGAETVTATLTLLNPDVGQLSDNNGAVYNQTTGVWSITGTVADVNTALANLTFIPRPDNDLDSTVAINIDDGNEDGSGPLLGTLKVFVDVPPEVSDDLIGDINDSPGEDAGDPVSESQEEIQEETPEESPEEQSAESSEGTVVTGGGSFGPLEASRDETSEFVSPFDELDQTQGAFEVSMANVASNNEQSAASVSESEKVVQFLRSQITQLNEPFELLDRDNFIRQLDDMRQELVEEQSQVEKLIGASVSVSAGLSVGYVIWLARSGIIMSSVLSSLPAWRLIDPLPVLATLSAPAAEEDRESLESMVTEANQSKSSGSDQNEPG
ncbi:VCBS domain-containing protein [Marinobacter sp. 1_MG-2023]|uniref:VCBS domain-containing protein n=1 Tax=Marinobacter sp. 1_MG-2023 TaxID=3062627 RepID=UPI0026E4097C|nr:VCBS domain-containing protein [Marinobacter sp. 1_MG-2023]MDO6823777.1 VCBS domain-containing protein [Marinobacter sp. 1_MG-2023]